MSSTRSFLTDISRSFCAGEISATSRVQTALEKVAELNGPLGMFVATFSESALQQAADLDDRIRSGYAPGPLAGAVLGVKDIIQTREGPTKANSTTLEGGLSAQDAPAVAALRRAGAIVLGKTTTSEFAVGLPDAEMQAQLPRNPWRPQHWTGGSSAGSAGALAAGAVHCALGSDTGGSIRTPAAYCGVTGLKPTYGLVPTAGTIPLAHSLDHVGPMARSAYDTALLLDVLAPGPAESYTSSLSGDLTGLRVGFDRLQAAHTSAEAPELEQVFTSALAALEDRGAQLTPVELPYYHQLSTAAMVTLYSEALAYHRRSLSAQWQQYGTPTRLALASGVFYTGGDYRRAQEVRGLGAKLIHQLFHSVDVIVTPTAGTAAPRYEDLDSAMETRLGGSLGRVYTAYWNALGNPAVSVPMGFSSDRLPLGLQIIGRHFDERGVLRAADAFQQETDWHLHQPNGH
ncbi:amidase [Nesterenkonia alkaliphila]|uniref:amidase n=1 Tax=Nesterenkonia alkaliphila TaxID=1463631 RepID=UPI0012F731DB|nr:amidase [Nesterenkonia alkaliphila]GFZ97427.1 glutamyl-tRNA(Gln) amidotransferase subunit A [Nesterenkonia alkaliphila]